MRGGGTGVDGACWLAWGSRAEGSVSTRYVSMTSSVDCSDKEFSKSASVICAINGNSNTVHLSGQNNFFGTDILFSVKM